MRLRTDGWTDVKWVANSADPDQMGQVCLSQYFGLLQYFSLFLEQNIYNLVAMGNALVRILYII